MISFLLRRRIKVPFRMYGTKPARCDAHMNELPIPCGPWQPWYDKKQTTYTAILLGGIAWFLFSLGMAIYTDSLYLNWGPPALPGPPSDAADCEDP